ncbi:MAG: fused MFS/spermidine synthase [bacterium]
MAGEARVRSDSQPGRDLSLESPARKPDPSCHALERPALFGSAFIAGWVVMMVELLGARLLAPYFGYSIYQWGALIGVVLTALTCGYDLGGRVGDRQDAGGFLLWALILAAACVLLTEWLAPLCLSRSRAAGPAWGAVLASALLVGPPSFLLGMVCPIVIRLTFTGGVAKAAGRVYVFSTLGSIAGTFFAAFFAIPALGTRTSHYLAGLLLLLAVVSLVLARRQKRYLASAGLLLLAGLPPSSRPPPGLVYETESVHNIIRVVDRPRDRALYLNYAAGPQSLMRGDELLTGRYYDHFLAGPLLNGARKILFLGAAGGTSLKQLVTVYPEVKVTGVELDPAVLKVAGSYFGLRPSAPIGRSAEEGV